MLGSLTQGLLLQLYWRHSYIVDLRLYSCVIGEFGKGRYRLMVGFMILAAPFLTIDY